VLDPTVAEKAAHTFPEATLVWLDQCGHYGWLEQPEVYFQAIDNYMKEIKEKN